MAFADNAGYFSSWTKLGSNTNSTIDLDNAAHFTDRAVGTKGKDLPNVSIINGQGINAQVRHECHAWIDYTDTFYSEHFDWPVFGDFTIMVNGAGTDLAADPGNITIKVQGSIDNGGKNRDKIVIIPQ
jgi:hypothetical protein